MFTAEAAPTFMYDIDNNKYPTVFINGKEWIAEGLRTPKYNDGRNDCYSISAQHVHNFQVYIYNRWGAEVFSSNDPNFCWDGTVNGTPSAQDVYTCVIMYSETPHSGLVRHTQTVTLIR